MDTHAHVCDPAFDEDRSEVLERAGEESIIAIIAVGETLSDAKKNLSKQSRFLRYLLKLTARYWVPIQTAAMSRSTF